MDPLSQQAEEQKAIEDWLSSDTDILAGRTLSEPQQKQLLKTLRFLRDDIHYQHPELALPSTWVLKNIIRASHASTYRPQKWHSDLNKILSEIESLIHLEQDGATQFYNDSMSKRLFPTIDNFHLEDLSNFVEAIKHHMDTIYSC